MKAKNRDFTSSSPLRTIMLCFLVSLAACSRSTKISPDLSALSLKQAEADHRPLLEALRLYKTEHGYYPVRKETLIESRFLAVSDLPQGTEYLSGDTENPKHCKEEFKDAANREAVILKEALACARKRTGKAVASYALARERCPEFFTETASNAPTLDVKGNCSVGLKSFKLVSAYQQEDRTLWLSYDSDKKSWFVSAKPPAFTNSPQK